MWPLRFWKLHRGLVSSLGPFSLAVRVHVGEITAAGRKCVKSFMLCATYINSTPPFRQDGRSPRSGPPKHR